MPVLWRTRSFCSKHPRPRLNQATPIIKALTPELPSPRAALPLFWIRFWLALFVAGLIVSGATAFPLPKELNFLYRVLHHFGITTGAVHDWVQLVLAALLESKARYPFLFYATDWLAFAHFVIALAFIGPWRDPVRNRWVIDFGILACLLVPPYALVLGAVRGIPWGWQLIDCSFGLLGLMPLLLARRLIPREHPL